MGIRTFINGLSLRQRLIALIFVVSAIVSVAGFGVMALLDLHRVRQGTVASAVLMARTVASYSVPDLEFNDDAAARKTLEKLSALPAVRDAYLLDADGRLFAALHPGQPPVLARDALAHAEFYGDTLKITEPVHQHGRYLGALYLVISTEGLQGEMLDVLLSLALMLTLALALSLGLSIWLQGVVSTPILRLASAAHHMTVKADFSDRVTPPSADEVGDLYRAFNALLDRVQEHDRARALAYDELRAGEQRVRLLLDSTAEGIYGADLDGICTFVNPACVRLLGYTTEAQLVGKHMHGLIHHTHADGRPYPDRDCRVRLANLRGQPAHADDEVHWRADGSSFPVEYWSHPIYQAGRLVGVVVTFIDISERKRTEEQLRTFAALVDTSTEFIGMSDPAGRVTYLNQAGCRLLGLRPDEVASKVISDFVLPEDRETVEREILPQMMATGNWHGEFRFRHFVTGAAVPVDQYAFVIRDERTGQPVALANISHDITERRHADEQIRQLNAELEQRVRERTAQLEATNRELEAFSYSVSHDLRAPLRAVDGFSQALLEDYGTQLDAAGKDYLQRVRSGAQSMAALIDDMLRLARVSRAPLQPAEVDLTALARDIAAELQSAHAQHRVTVDIAPGMRCHGDPGLLRIALENLLGNAWKYTSKTPSAHVAFRAEHHGTETVYQLRDNGVGFDMQYAGKLFGAFQRLHRKDEFEGTGIGLATVARIVHRHGGRVWAEGRPGEGAVFSFTLGEGRQDHSPSLS